MNEITITTQELGIITSLLHHDLSMQDSNDLANILYHVEKELHEKLSKTLERQLQGGGD